MREAPAAAPADPSRAADMDNASFVATLPPELRREVLLSADEALLNTLPPNLVAEAMVLRERIPHQVGGTGDHWMYSLMLHLYDIHNSTKNVNQALALLLPKKTPA